MDLAFVWSEEYNISDLSEISRGGGGVGILNLGSEIRWPIPAMGVKFANPPLELGLKYHDPPHLTELKEKCSRLLNVPGALKVFQANKKKKGNKNKIKGKQQKLGQKEWK